MTSVLVIGRGGQLALSLAERASAKDVALDFRARPEVDLLDAASLRKAVRESGAATIVNAAAYTAVDQAEDEPDTAHAINAVAPGIIAEAAREAGARLVHISTDYVFDGTGDRPWTEKDATGPRSVYGRTKLAGEAAVRAALPQHAIVRTAWVYSPFGRNFVRTMLDLARTRPQLRVVADQVGNPTSALDIADAILAMIVRWRTDASLGLGGTYHLAGTGATSWADFAREIFSLSRARGGPSAEVEGIATAAWPARAARPLNSRLNTDLFAATFDYRAPRWEDSLERVVDRLLVGVSKG